MRFGQTGNKKTIILPKKKHPVIIFPQDNNTGSRSLPDPGHLKKITTEENKGEDYRDVGLFLNPDKPTRARPSRPYRFLSSGHGLQELKSPDI